MHQNGGLSPSPLPAGNELDYDFQSDGFTAHPQIKSGHFQSALHICEVMLYPPPTSYRLLSLAIQLRIITVNYAQHLKHDTWKDFPAAFLSSLK